MKNIILTAVVAVFSFAGVASANNDVVCQAPVNGVHMCLVEKQYYKCVDNGTEFICEIVTTK